MLVKWAMTPDERRMFERISFLENYAYSLQQQINDLREIQNAVAEMEDLV